MIPLLLAALARADEPAPGPLFEDTAAPALEPVAPEPVVAAPPDPFHVDLPSGPRDALGLGAATLALVAVGAAAGRGQASLREAGALPGALGVTAVAARALAAVSGAGAALALVPAGLAGVAPFVVVGLALAVGWSARDALPDLVARAVLAAEGRLRTGSWIRGEGFAGRIEALGVRATWIVDRRGNRVAVPNRRLLAEALTTGGPHPEVEVAVALPGVPAAEARAALVEAALGSPWIAPGAVPEVGADPLHPGRWIVRMRLVDGRFEDRFAGTLPERVHESLSQ